MRVHIGMGADKTPASVAANQVASQLQMEAEAAYVSQLEHAILSQGYTPQTLMDHVSENSLGVSGDVYHISIAEFPNGEPILIDSVPLQSADQLARQIISNDLTFFQTTGQTTSTGSPPQAPNVTSVGALIVNLSRPTSSSFQVGDRWQLRVTGPPNLTVSATVKHPSGSTDSTVYGSTDGSGNFNLTGTMDDSTLGHWVETWHVGNQDAPAIAFDVEKAPTPLLTYQQSTGQQTTQQTTEQSIQDILGNLLPAGTVSSVPSWVWLAGGAALFLFFTMGRKQ